MPLPIAHGLLGASLVAAIHPRPARRHFIPLLVGAFLANAADLDFALVFILRSKAWHRGFSHSITFALLVTLSFVLLLGASRVREAVAYGSAFASHAVLDYVTTKEGGGVDLLWPFSSERLVLGWVGLSELPSQNDPAAGRDVSGFGANAVCDAPVASAGCKKIFVARCRYHGRRKLTTACTRPRTTRPSSPRPRCSIGPPRRLMRGVRRTSGRYELK
jgi:membrane-bound metal-dependent hydrolase YbcI (DUF457 family)